MRASRRGVVDPFIVMDVIDVIEAARAAEIEEGLARRADFMGRRG